MTEPLKTLVHSDYTVGWICALSIELTVAGAMLDEEHPVLPAKDPHDTNAYLLGKMGDHNVVIACLPAEKTGKVSAAMVAKDLLRSFESVRFGLLVGVGGGAPYYSFIEKGGDENENDDSENEASEDDDSEGTWDVRLGDVVISLHSKSTEAVVQYDFGKSIQGREFVHTGSLNKPPDRVLTAVNMLQSLHERKGHKICELVSKMLEDNPRLARKFQKPDSGKDRLFKSDFVHPEENKSCKACISTHSLVRRKDRVDTAPVLHYGTIGSADQVMKDALLRDNWAEKEGIICFEMEAAGLMDSFPCLRHLRLCRFPQKQDLAALCGSNSCSIFEGISFRHSSSGGGPNSSNCSWYVACWISKFLFLSQLNKPLPTTKKEVDFLIS